MSEVFAAEICASRGEYKSSIAIYWAAIKRNIFQNLDRKGIAYRSTESALAEYISLQENVDKSEKIFVLYHISILIDTGRFNETREEINRFLEICRDISRFMSISIHAEDRQLSIVSEILDSFKDDCSTSASCHFISAQRFEALQTILAVSIAFFTASIALFNSDPVVKLIADLGFQLNVSLFNQVTSLIAAALSSYSLASNWKTRLEKHRVVANKYLTIARDIQMVKSEIYSEEMNDRDFAVNLEKIRSIKSTINNITQDAPQIPKWAFEKHERQKHKA